MKQDVEKLIQILEDEKSNLKIEKNKLKENLLQLKIKRTDTARKTIDEIISSLTIRQIINYFPNFKIPFASNWFGLFRKVNFDTLKIHLGTYLDNNPDIGKKIYEWKDVLSLDNQITNILNLISDNSKKQTEIDNKIKALEKFNSNVSTSSCSVINPKVRDKFEKSLKLQIENKQETQQDNSGIDLLTMWFWLNILSSDSEIYEHNSIIPENLEVAPQVIESNYENIEVVPQVTINDELVIHENLGSQNFS